MLAPIVIAQGISVPGTLTRVSPFIASVTLWLSSVGGCTSLALTSKFIIPTLLQVLLDSILLLKLVVIVFISSKSHGEIDSEVSIASATNNSQHSALLFINLHSLSQYRRLSPQPFSGGSHSSP
jgi:hypothetical protein